MNRKLWKLLVCVLKSINVSGCHFGLRNRKNNLNDPLFWFFSILCKSEFSQNIGRFLISQYTPNNPFSEEEGKTPNKYSILEINLDYQSVFLLLSVAWKLWWGWGKFSCGTHCRVKYVMAIQCTCFITYSTLFKFWASGLKMS